MDKKAIAFIAALAITMVGSVGAVMGGVFATNIGRADAYSTGYVEYPTTVAAGSSSVLAIVNGCLYSWGNNVNGALGLGDNLNYNTPQRVGTKTDWVSVFAGTANNSFAIDSKGHLYAWGYNGGGQLGLGDTVNRNQPERVGNKKWRAVFPGRHSLGLDSDGYLYSWGENPNGQLGLGHTTDFYTPQKVGDKTWKAISGTFRSSLALDSDGYLYSWGLNDYGQLGLGDKQERHEPTRIGDENGWVKIGGGSGSNTTQVGGALYVLSEMGTLYSWGSNNYGQLGIGLDAGTDVYKTDFTQIGAAGNWKSVDVGQEHAFAIDKNDNIWAWGRNHVGQLGIGTSMDHNAPKKVGSKTWEMVSGGGSFSIAVDTEGRLWTWGTNGSGQLGDGTNATKNVPTEIKYMHPDPITPYPVEIIPPYDPRLDETKTALLIQMGNLKSILGGENTDLAVRFIPTAAALLEEMETAYYDENADPDEIADKISQAKYLIIINPAKFAGLVEAITKTVDDQDVTFTAESWTKYQSKLSQINALLEELESRLQTIDSQEQTIFDQQQLLDEIETLYEQLNELYLAQQGLEPAGDPNTGFDPLVVGLIIACGFLVLGIPLTYILARRKK